MLNRRLTLTEPLILQQCPYSRPISRIKLYYPEHKPLIFLEDFPQSCTMEGFKHLLVDYSARSTLALQVYPGRQSRHTTQQTDRITDDVHEILRSYSSWSTGTLGLNMWNLSPYMRLISCRALLLVFKVQLHGRGATIAPKDKISVAVTHRIYNCASGLPKIGVPMDSPSRA